MDSLNTIFYSVSEKLTEYHSNFIAPIDNLCAPVSEFIEGIAANTF